MAASHRRPRSHGRRRYTAQRIRTMEGSALLALASVAIAMVTLTPSGAREAPDACLICGPHAGADVILNFALFLPVGAALALLGAPKRIALAVAVGMSLAIELAQLALPIGRIASLSDLLAYVAGAAIGLYATRRRRAILYPRSHAALRYAMIGSGLWLFVLLATAVLLRPTLPGGEYIAQWRPALDGPRIGAGRVVAASVSGIPLPDGPVERTDAIRRALDSDLHMDVQAEFGPARVGAITGIFRLLDDSGQEVMLMAQRGHDLVFRTRLLASELRLVTPSVVMFDALEGIDLANPRVLAIGGRHEAGTLRLSAYGREQTLRLHSASGWMFLVPPASPILRRPGAASALWIGLPLFIVGYWTGRRARRKARRSGDAFRLTGTGGQVLSALPALGLLVAVGLGAIPLAVGLALPAGSVWGAAAAALGLGLLGGMSTALSRDDRAHGQSPGTSPSAALADA